MHYYMYDVNVSDSGICSAMQTSLIAGHAGTITGILGEIRTFVHSIYVRTLHTLVKFGIAALVR